MKDNKKKLYFRRTIRTLCFFLAIIATCLVLQRYFLRNTDHNSLRIEGFYQEDRDSLDAVLIGASDIYTSFILSVIVVITIEEIAREVFVGGKDVCVGEAEIGIDVKIVAAAQRCRSQDGQEYVFEFFHITSVLKV